MTVKLILDIFERIIISSYNGGRSLGGHDVSEAAFLENSL